MSPIPISQRRKYSWNFEIYLHIIISVKAMSQPNVITLFQIFIFCPKIQLWFPEKIAHFLGEKHVKMLWFWTF